MTAREIRRDGLIGFLLTLAVLIVYWPVGQFGFVEYDDNLYVFDNPEVRRGLSWWGLVWSFVDAHAANFHPLTWLSHMLDCQLFGLNAGAHHWVNVILHAANAVLLFLLLRSLTGRVGRSAVVAALFALHPLRVESVAWISERKDVLAGFFFMLTVWAYAAFAKSRSGSAPVQGTSSSPGVFRSKLYCAALVFFVLGLLAKPMLVTIPGVLLLLDFWLLKRVRSDSETDSVVGGVPKRLWMEKIPFAAVAVIFGVLTVLAQKSGGAVKPAGLASKLANTICAYVAYLAKTVWPHDLSVVYLRPDHIPLAQVLGALAILLAITVVALLSVRRRPYVAVGWFWFVGMMLPVSGLVTIGDLFMADRYTYLPGIGLSLAIVWCVADLVGSRSSPTSLRIATIAIATAVLGACAVASRIQLQYWRNTETLMQRALQLDPRNFVAHYNLGVYYGKSGNVDAALLHRQRARELTPPSEREDSP